MKVLEQISQEPRPIVAVDPRERNRLLRRGLVAIVFLPYKKEGSCKHFQITPRGRKALGFQNSARRGIDMAT